MHYRITYIVLAFGFYLELKFAKKTNHPVEKITLYLTILSKCAGKNMF